MVNNSTTRISVVIPSFNQSDYLESCLVSILQQDYQDFELILMDGGSKDNSIEIIKKYSEKISYWQSKPDGGQTQAITLGFQIASGQLLTWLNSDDILLPGALSNIRRVARQNPGVDVFYGDHIVIDKNGTVVESYRHPPYYSRLAWLTMPYIAQPGTVFTRRIWEMVGGIDTDMQCAFDYDLWYRFMEANAQFVHIGDFVAGFRRHPESKGFTWLERYAHEHAVIRQRYHTYFGPSWKRKLGRLTLMAIQTISGAYLHTLAFRLLRHHRLTTFQP